MLTRKTLFSAAAIAVPVAVFAMTAMTEPGGSGAMAPDTTKVIAVNGTVSESISQDSLRQTAGASIPTSAPPARAATSESSAPESSTMVEAFTEPYRDISVAASEMGTLSEVRVVEGAIVKQGDILAVMDADILRASLEVARRSMNAEGLLKSAQADLDMKIQEQEKLKQLRERDHASQQEVDRIETEIRIAEARLLSVNEDLEVKQLESRRIESQLKQRQVIAPMDGVISELSREAGEFVSPSDPTIARLVQLDPLLIVFSVPLSQRNEFEKDQVVELKLGTNQVRAEGIVEYVSPTSDTSNSSVRVKVRLPNSVRQHQSGERAILVMEHSGENSPLAVPAAPETTRPETSVPAAENVNMTPEETSGTQGKSTPVAVRN
ncbi:MAG: efflux RND transporter periplasmic adaptor subunit [Planctomycetales bacterium]|nr:efflux RND transporter periplasmic adaptor subunit [Planctomycetales bacterium]